MRIGLDIIGQRQAQYSLVIILIVSTLVSCMPWPHFYYHAPAVEGVVTNNEVPVQNAEINVSTKFSEEQQKSVTDSNGRFSTKPIREFMFFASLLGDPLYGYTVTITNAANQYEGFGEGHVGYAPEKRKVVCDLSKPIQLQNAKRYCTGPANE